MQWLVRRPTRTPIEVTMDKRFAHLLELGKRAAELRSGQLMNEVSVLFASFPHLSDAFDTDGLPVSFIIKRDSRGAQIKAVGRHESAPAAVRHPANQERRHKAWSKRLTRGTERHFETRERG
jgi:hypothetical protein